MLSRKNALEVQIVGLSVAAKQALQELSSSAEIKDFSCAKGLLQDVCVWPNAVSACNRNR